MFRRKWFFQPTRFLLSGALATASHWIVMIVLLILETTPPIATAAGAFIGAIINYQLQRNLTFKSKVSHRYALLRYTGVCVISWIANLALFVLLYHNSQFTPYVAQGITTFVLAFSSFYFYKRIVFNDKQAQSAY